MPDKPSVWQQTKLLNRYYEKVGLAAAGEGICPKFVEFRAGYGLVDDSDSAMPQLLPISGSMSEIPNEFYRGICEVEFSKGMVICKCEIPQSAVSEPVRHNLVGIFDQDSELIAICQTLPDWVTPSEVYRAFPTVTFPYDED